MCVSEREESEREGESYQMRVEVNLWRVLNYTIHGADIIVPPHRVITVVRIFTITAILVRLFSVAASLIVWNQECEWILFFRHRELHVCYCVSVPAILLRLMIFQRTMCEYAWLFFGGHSLCGRSHFFGVSLIFFSSSSNIGQS